MTYVFFSSIFDKLRKLCSLVGSLIAQQYYRLLTVIFLLVCSLQLLDCPTLNDDMVYRFVFQSDDAGVPRLVQNINDLLESQWCHYQIINGRWLVHTIAQAFYAFSSPCVYQIINSFLFVLLLHLSVCLIGERQRRTFSALLVCFFLFVVFRGVRTTMLWSLGSFNYLWVTVMTIAFLLLLRKVDCQWKPIHWIVSPLSLLAGSSHEAISLPLSITFIIYLFFHRKEVFRQPILLYIVWYIIGTGIVIFSPGVWHRAGDGIMLTDRVISGVVNLAFNIRVTWLLLLCLFITFRNSRALLMDELRQHCYAYMTLMMCVIIVFCCGTNLERVAFFADFISTLLLVRLLSEKSHKNWCKLMMRCCGAVMLVFYAGALFLRAENFHYYQSIKKQMAVPDKEIISVSQPASGNIILDYLRGRYVNPSVEFGYYCVYMGFNSNDLNIRDAAILCNKPKVVFLPEDVVSNIENDSTAYEHYELDAHGKLFIWRLRNNQPVNKIVFRLNPENLADLSWGQRLLAYKNDTYELDDHFHYSVITVQGCNYLVFTCPTTNIHRRIKDITYE